MLTTRMLTKQCIAPSVRYGVKAILKGNLYYGLKNSNPGLRRTPNDIPCREEVRSVTGEAGCDGFFGDFFFKGVVVLGFGAGFLG